MECENSDESLKRIVWIASYPKAGNTWVRMFLQSYITGVKCELGSSYRLIQRDTDPLAYRSVSPIPLPDARAEVGLGLRYPAMLHLIQRNYGGDTILKTHNIYAAATSGLHLCPPSLTKMAIYLIRDPRDILVSFSHHLTISIDETIDLMCHERGHLKDPVIGFGHHMSSWANHVSCWVACRDFPVCIVKYEGMIADTRNTFYKIVEFMFGDGGVNEQLLDFAISETEFSKLQKKETDEGFREQRGDAPFFRVGKVGKWKDVLTTEQVTRLEAGIGEAMERMGYKCVTRDVQIKETVA